MNKIISTNSFAMCLLASIIAIINIGLISLFPVYLYIYFIITFTLIFLVQKNILSIYGPFNSDYKTGNSYLKRMFETVGLFNLIIYMLLSIVVYLFSLVNSYLAFGLLIIIILIPFEHLLLKAWSRYDTAKYAEIDRQNPNQKKYWNEPRSQYQKRTKW